MMNQLASLVGLLQSAQTHSKILHWKTRSFAQHLALDELNAHLAKSTDALAETALGVFPGCLDDLQQTATDFSESDARVFICQLIDTVSSVCESIKESSDALENVIDDLMQGLFTVKYKLEQLS